MRHPSCDKPQFLRQAPIPAASALHEIDDGARIQAETQRDAHFEHDSDDEKSFDVHCDGVGYLMTQYEAIVAV